MYKPSDRKGEEEEEEEVEQEEKVVAVEEEKQLRALQTDRQLVSWVLKSL